MLRLAFLLALLLPACGGAQAGSDVLPLQACEGCGAAEAPADLTPTMRIAPAGEPGTRLVIQGTVYQPDGRTPAPGVLMYAYHTNEAGEYPTRGDERGNDRRHGYLRGWLMTDSAGRYTIHTIRPGAYRTRADPQHIHVTFTPPGRREQWADEILFADDPRAQAASRTGDGTDILVTVGRGADGTLRAVRDFILDSGTRREIGDFRLPPAGS